MSEKANPLLGLVVSRADVLGYAEWHAKMRKTQIVCELKHKLREARRSVRIIDLKLKLAKETHP